MRRSEMHSKRDAFTVLEIIVVLTGLTVAMVLVAEVGVSSLIERREAVVRQEALETAANILETAQAAGWESLTPEWASTQRLPESLTQRISQAQLKVSVEPEANHSRIKRVAVAISWQRESGGAARAVQLTGLFGDRSAPVPGGPSK